MNQETFLKDLKSRNTWDNPLDISKYLNTPEETLTNLLANGYNAGLQTIVLKNIRELVKIDTQVWLNAIENAANKEDKYMMGLINLVDTFYKYLQIDIRSMLSKIEIDKSKLKQVISYYEDCPICLKIDADERLNYWKKYDVVEKSVNLMQDKFSKIGATLVSPMSEE